MCFCVAQAGLELVLILLNAGIRSCAAMSSQVDNLNLNISSDVQKEILKLQQATKKPFPHL